jgi:hypothetical protein
MNKTLGLELLQKVNILYAQGQITKEEKNEYASIVGAAMKPNADVYYTILRDKIKEKITDKKDEQDTMTNWKNTLFAEIVTLIESANPNN